MLYEEHPTGGPLHVFLDDNNLDTTISPYYLSTPGYDYDYDAPREDLDGRTTRSVCEEISQILNDMTEAQRYAAIALWDGYYSTEDTP